MTKLGKALVVFVTVMSLAFVAFIGVTAIGGPNWRAQAAEMNDYGFKRAPGDVPTWEVTHRVSGEIVTNAPSLPAALRDAQRHQQQQQTQAIAALDTDIKAAQTTIDAEKSASAADAEGIDKRLAQLNQLLGQLEQQVAEVTRQGTKQAELAGTTRAQVAARRGDVARLKTELSQVRVDRYRINEQIQQLEQRLIRLGGQINRADRRHQQLETREGGYNPAPQT